MTAAPSEELRDLARSYGVQVDYQDMAGKTNPASAASLLAVLRALGADLLDESQAPRALRDRRLSTWRRRVEPVVVAWDDAPPTFEARVLASSATAPIDARLATESGEVHEWSTTPDRPGSTEDVAGESFAVVAIPLPTGLPAGYHRLTVTFEDGHEAGSLLIAAPRRAYPGPGTEGKRPWGVFCPLYALHRGSSLGAGDFADLEALIDWTAGLGGGLVASLPMLASNFDGPDPVVSPYSPTSRLFWNEFYLDLARIPEMAGSEAARALLASEEAQVEIGALRGSELVDYGRQMKLKRAVLEVLAAHFFEGGSPDRTAAFRDFRARHPEVESFAFFQAAGEEFGRDWRAWPASLADPVVGNSSEVDPKAIQYHLYAQWQADEQLGALAAKARGLGLSWYLDFPVGVDFNSFDVWTHRRSFATGASVGCPPDPTFTKGQNWGFPPLHPDRQREAGYAYLIASFRNHLRYANALRLDHVMGLHRLYWIPQGAEAKDGAFVSTPAEEAYAILSVESHRASAWLVGEDLGTVPPEVEGAMKRHNVRGMYVAQYEVRPEADRPLREVPVETVSGVNTHDMPPFAAYWEGLDLEDRHDLGLIDDDQLESERGSRQSQRQAVVDFLHSEKLLPPGESGAGPVLHALWAWLAASPSSVLLLNLEDLWLETASQNTPNTYLERPNWRRKLRSVFERFADDPAILEPLRRVDQLRARPPAQALIPAAPQRAV